MDLSIAPRGDRDQGSTIYGRRQHSAAAVIQVRTHEVYPPRREKQLWNPGLRVVSPETAKHLCDQPLWDQGSRSLFRISHDSTIHTCTLYSKHRLALPPSALDSYRLNMQRRLAPTVLVPILLCLTAGCSTLEHTQFEGNPEAGTFAATGVALTLFSIDIPKSALNIARENASDANLTNMEVKEAVVTPYLGWFDWLLDIVGIRRARIEGTYGFQNS